MDFTTIIEKALKGEDYSADIKDFDDSQKTDFSIALRTRAEDESKKELEKIVALRKEKDRIDLKNNPPVTPTTPETPSTQDGFKKFREEQVEKAKVKLFSQYELSDEEKTKITEVFEKLDSGKVDAEFILKDFESAFAAVKGPELLSSKKELDSLKQGASDFNAQGAFVANTISVPEGTEFSDLAKAIYQGWQKAGFGPEYTIQRAQKVADKQSSR